MSTSVDQVARLLALVPYLQANPDADLHATAETFGVSPRRLLADLQVLWFVGTPGGMPGDLIEIDMDAATEHGRIRLTNAPYLARPMRFTLEEVTSLIVALRAVREVTGGPSGAAVDSALAKLAAVAGVRGPSESGSRSPARGARCATGWPRRSRPGRRCGSPTTGRPGPPPPRRWSSRIG